ncbi:hypothetical protein BSL78_09124 [Apostichopus japonicus]|uniref:SRCR domain-containing protein n=1 Tax=Stichopus japonicus TaxID=307972 RepID=A0A2G8L156_STIJA|nr:hypothetical protein BSL78_09124 [Apostichopus japonicus]
MKSDPVRKRSSRSLWRSLFWKRQRRIAMDNVACVGNEFSLGECRFTPGSQSSCGHDKDVGILCGTAQTHVGTCGVRAFEHGAHVKIVGGSSAKHGSWPWQVH